ncbi:hypothetical protein FJZ20_01700 [Candidatus Pacearchaeota archaeon]|nr:hypothetical protein [Candidatus Pacearchaeota archaeon]
MKPNNKRGLSNIVATLIIILLVIVAAGIIWVVVKNVVTGSAEDVQVASLTTNLKIQSMVFEDDDVIISIKRNPGKGKMNMMKFIVSDGITTVIIDKNAEDFEELETRTFTLNSSELQDLAFVKEVSIIPVIEENRKQVVGSESDDRKFSAKQILINMGAVSWWRFEGNAKDEFGKNNGIIYGANCDVGGKFGNSCNFTGGSNPNVTNASYIEVPSAPDLNGLNEFTYLAWVKADRFNPVSLHNQIMGKSVHAGGEGRAQMGMWVNPGVYQWWEPEIIHGRAETIIGRFDREGPTLELNQWHHIALVFYGNDLEIYVDSQISGIELRLDGTPTDPSSIDPTQLVQNNDPLRIGCGYYRCGFDSTSNYDYRWLGLIDEVIILNRAITQKQVEALYNLDLLLGMQN